MYADHRNSVGAEFGSKKRRVEFRTETPPGVKDFIGQTYITSNAKLYKLSEMQLVSYSIPIAITSSPTSATGSRRQIDNIGR